MGSDLHAHGRTAPPAARCHRDTPRKRPVWKMTMRGGGGEGDSAPVRARQCRHSGCQRRNQPPTTPPPALPPLCTRAWQAARPCWRITPPSPRGGGALPVPLWPRALLATATARAWWWRRAATGAVVARRCQRCRRNVAVGGGAVCFGVADERKRQAVAVGQTRQGCRAALRSSTPPSLSCRKLQTLCAQAPRVRGGCRRRRIPRLPIWQAGDAPRPRPSPDFALGCQAEPL